MCYNCVVLKYPLGTHGYMVTDAVSKLSRLVLDLHKYNDVEFFIRDF